MSNQIVIQRTTFINGFDITSDSKSYGYRMYDDIGVTYNNNLKQNQLQMTDEELVRYVSNFGDNESSLMLDCALENGLTVDDKHYDSKWVQKTLGCEEKEEVLVDK